MMKSEKECNCEFKSDIISRLNRPLKELHVIQSSDTSKCDEIKSKSTCSYEYNNNTTYRQYLLLFCTHEGNK